MKKSIAFLILLIIISVQFIGCTKIAKVNSQNEKQTIEKTVRKSDSEIRAIAYNSLTKEMKDTIINFGIGTVEEFKCTRNPQIGSPNGLIDKNGKDTYVVTFHTNNEGILGQLGVYLDKDSYKFLGCNLGINHMQVQY